jgi:two-component system sensor histidine kinase BaeS
MNLLSNAIEHNEPGGRVELACRIEMVRENEAGDVELSVSDTGRGIPAEHLPYLFQPFYRLDSAREQDTASMGLGLALVKTHVTALGGDIAVSSEPGVGSVFTVRLPGTAAPLGTDHATSKSAAPPAPAVKPVVAPALAEVEK